MTSIRFCGAGQHKYVTSGTRSKCSICGSIQVDLTGNGDTVEVDPTKVFSARRPTLFSVRLENEQEARFGKGRVNR